MRESAAELRSKGSSEESRPCEESDDASSAAGEGTFSGACSNVASATAAAELHRLAEVALRALGAGEIDLAKELLQALMGVARAESTGCGGETER